MYTYIKLHFSFFIIYFNLFPNTKLHESMLDFESQEYEFNHTSTPLIVYIIQFKENPYPPTHPITKIINFFKK